MFTVIGNVTCLHAFYQCASHILSDEYLLVKSIVKDLGSYSFNWTPSLGTSICRGCGPKKTKKKQKKIWVSELYTQGKAIIITIDTRVRYIHIFFLRPHPPTPQQRQILNPLSGARD